MKIKGIQEHVLRAKPPDAHQEPEEQYDESFVERYLGQQQSIAHEKNLKD